MIALVSMTIDHMVKMGILGTNMVWLSDTVGRLAFPIFGFLVMKHFANGKRGIFKKYCIRLGLFGLIATPILLAVNMGEQLNILFTFLWPILFIEALKNLKTYVKPDCEILKWLFPALLFVVMIPIILVTDYWFMGFFYLIALYAWFNNPNAWNGVACMMPFLLEPGLACVIQILTVFGLLGMNNYMGGKRLLKKWWLFYTYYPAHFILLHLLKLL